MRANIERIAPGRRPLFDRLHRLILAAHPDAIVGLPYQAPTHTVGNRRLHVGAWKPGLSVHGRQQCHADAFTFRHPTLKTSKGTLRLGPDDAAAISDGESRDRRKRLVEISVDRSLFRARHRIRAAKTSHAVRSGTPAPTFDMWDAHPGRSAPARRDPVTPTTPNAPVNLSTASTSPSAWPATHSAPASVASGPRTAAARCAIAAILGYQALSMAAVAANPQWNPLTRQLSEYALGHHAWLQIAAFLASALSYAALLIALRPHITDAAGRAGLAILTYRVLATIGVGVFVTDPLSTTPMGVSTHGTLHVVFGASALVLFPVAALLLTRSLARAHPSRYPSRRALHRIAILPLTGLALIWVPELSGLLPARGWPDRILFLTYTAWVIAVSAPLARRQTDH